MIVLYRSSWAVLWASPKAMQQPLPLPSELFFGMNLVDISEALYEYHGPKGRLKILKGIKNSTIIDDTYNASPLSTHLALETLRDLPGTRRVAVLGDMLELGKYTIDAHKEAGNVAGRFVGLFVCVGSRAD